MRNVNFRFQDMSEKVAWRRFNMLFKAMVVSGSPPDRRKSRKDSRDDDSDTRTPSCASKGGASTHGGASRGLTASSEPKSSQSS